MEESMRRRSGQSKVGVVVKKSGAKTVKVQVERVLIHPIYKKYVRSRTTYLVHDPDDRSSVGDTVEIAESRPLSARKRWRVRRQIGRQEGAVRALETRRDG